MSLPGQPLSAPPLRVILAQPRGFCAGVERAIEIVERALRKFGQPVYVRHEIVHNKRVVEDLKARGARFVEEVDDIPENAVAIFSAHGVSRAVEVDAIARSLRVIDATCPLVTKVHKEGQRYAVRHYDVVLIGHPGHPEVEGTMGQIDGPVHLVSSVKDVATLAPRDPNCLAYVTQTTLSVDDTRDIIGALKARFPSIVGPDVKDICYATQNRQTAVRTLADQVDLILVVGAHNSSNSNRLREIGQTLNKPSHLIEDADALQLDWLDGVATVGISAGASAPEELVQEVVAKLAEWRQIQVERMAGIEEDIHFKLPAELAGPGE
ncbi:1-hydroxy-2-methyl-2-(E)-butenyl 4-diphosphate reductase [uncultured Gammaproteobacteria bacterium]